MHAAMCPSTFSMAAVPDDSAVTPGNSSGQEHGTGSVDLALC